MEYRKQEDVPQPRSLTIASITVENVAMDNQPADNKAIITWQEADLKPMVLNRTNANILQGVFGDMTEAWIGKQVVVFNDPTIQFQGRLTGGLRLRIDVPAAPAQPDVPGAPVGGDDIPW